MTQGHTRSLPALNTQLRGAGMAVVVRSSVDATPPIDLVAADLSDFGADDVSAYAHALTQLATTCDLLRPMFQGFFFGPTVTASAVKGAIFAAAMYEKLGFDTFPRSEEVRHDIVQAITFHRPDAMIAFCQGIQAASPIDSFVTPYPDDMPGYDSQVIMAAGAFVSGSTMELSADGPMRDPYTIYYQGGLTWPHARFGILKSVQTMIDRGIVTLPPEPAC